MSKEAMKLALEALEYIEHNYMSLPAPAEKAITALREALAGLPAQQALDKMAENARELGLDYEPPAKQEPVAFFDPQSKGFYWAKPTKVIPPVTVDVEPLPLYTSPPAQRTWVGLSDAELVEFSSAELGPYDLCLEVEAKLKEKNT